jgi:hypothetical protein
MVDKILKGTNPAEIPVEQPTKFEFVINLKIAKQISLTIPPEVVAWATKVIRSGTNGGGKGVNSMISDRGRVNTWTNRCGSEF